MCNIEEIVNESFIKVDELKKDLNIMIWFWFWSIFYDVHTSWLHIHIFEIYDIVQKVYWELKEAALEKFDIQFELS